MANHIVLLVEDSPDDEYFCRQLLQQIVVNHVVCVRDGRQAISYLEGTGEFADRDRFPIPDILLLDLKIPYVDGFGVLEWFKKHPNFNKTHIVVLSQWGETRDIQRAYGLGAHSFLTKPLKREDVLNLASHYKNFWCLVPSLPAPPAPPIPPSAPAV